jgi:hypothetical protein
LAQTEEEAAMKDRFALIFAGLIALALAGSPARAERAPDAATELAADPAKAKATPMAPHAGTSKGTKNGGKLEQSDHDEKKPKPKPKGPKPIKPSK